MTEEILVKFVVNTEGMREQHDPTYIVERMLKELKEEEYLGFYRVTYAEVINDKE